ncbi:hypothetical protein [Burkholderia pyrrocinia]|uniref:hypothetical protein n=1 Tax=Burkholderia pyrrocinia TaxID=60550 RepID=UPI002AB2AD1B|nr:hypothetical protein [Burkholderia pyrrocinia]
MVIIAPLSPDGPNGYAGALRLAGGGPLQTARDALPRGGAYATAIPCSRTRFLSWKTDLYQFADTTTLSADTLLCSIAVHTGIAKHGLDLGSVMTHVAEQVPLLTGASAAAVEFAEGDDMVYRPCVGGDEFDGHALRLGASVGIAMLPDGTDMSALIERADQSMYAVKRTRG